jgi:hypothetical protein
MVISDDVNGVKLKIGVNVIDNRFIYYDDLTYKITYKIIYNIGEDYVSFYCYDARYFIGNVRFYDDFIM